jgi:NADH pyrophosphatase NudC (nudix superfamily)
MRCQRCLKKMRLKKDGWKRCGKCGTQAMGLALRVQMMGEPCEIVQGPAIRPSAIILRLPVKWRAEA